MSVTLKVTRYVARAAMAKQVGQDWHEAKKEWCDPDRPFDPSWNVPAKQSVKSEMPEWKLRAIYGNNIPREEEKQPRGGHG